MGHVTWAKVQLKWIVIDQRRIANDFSSQGIRNLKILHFLNSQCFQWNKSIKMIRDMGSKFIVKAGSCSLFALFTMQLSQWWNNYLKVRAISNPGIQPKNPQSALIWSFMVYSWLIKTLSMSVLYTKKYQVCAFKDGADLKTAIESGGQTFHKCRDRRTSISWKL